MKFDRDTIKVQRLGERYTVSWEDADTRFHVWLNDYRQPEATIYKNKKATQNSRYHRATKSLLEKHPKIEATIKALPQSLFEVANLEHRKREELEAGERKQAHLKWLGEEAAKYGLKLVPA